jgi:hypothetical protein
LGIGSIPAYSPQAKGRVERSFRTAQDRLVKQLRLAKISTIEDANLLLEKEYWPEWNECFARPVKDFLNRHRALTESQDLAAIVCHVEDRVIANDYMFSFAAQRYQIQRRSGWACQLACAGLTESERIPQARGRSSNQSDTVSSQPLLCQGTRRWSTSGFCERSVAD